MEARSAFAVIAAVIATAAALVAMFLIMQLEDETPSKADLRAVTNEVVSLRKALRETSGTVASSKSSAASLADDMDKLQADFGKLETRQARTGRDLETLSGDLGQIRRRVAAAASSPSSDTKADESGPRSDSETVAGTG